LSGQRRGLAGAVFQAQPPLPTLKPTANSDGVECRHPITHQEPCMTHLDLTARRFSPSGPAQRRGSAFARSRALLREWLARSRERRALLELDERTLKDIGLTRADIVVESRKSFWER